MQIGWRLITHREEIGRLIPEVYGLMVKIAPEFFGSAAATALPPAAAASPTYNVKWLQESLVQLGHNPGPIDGIMGPRTEQAISAFQAATGLVADGWAGSATLAALDNALSRALGRR